ncbi:MAG: YciI family protein [Pirellulales bacterium]
MKYILLMYNEENAFSPDELPAAQADAVQTCHELHTQGKYVGASPLHPVATAASVGVREGRPVVTDGPFAETKEQLGGYVLIDVETLDEAIGIAARFPSAEKGTVEVRQLLEKA